jgi:hypothetical protein
MYAGRMSANHPKKRRGNATIPREWPKAVKGRAMPTPITASVESASASVERAEKSRAPIQRIADRLSGYLATSLSGLRR